MRHVRHLQRTGEIPGNGWEVAVCRRWGTGVDLPGRGGGTEHQLGVVPVVSSARCGRTALSSVAIRFEACWGRAFLLGTSERCRPATGLCGVCARKLAFLGGRRRPRAAAAMWEPFAVRGFGSYCLPRPPSQSGEHASYILGYGGRCHSCVFLGRPCAWPLSCLGEACLPR